MRRHMHRYAGTCMTTTHTKTLANTHYALQYWGSLGLLCVNCSMWMSEGSLEFSEYKEGEAANSQSEVWLNATCYAVLWVTFSLTTRPLLQAPTRVVLLSVTLPLLIPVVPSARFILVMLRRQPVLFPTHTCTLLVRTCFSASWHYKHSLGLNLRKPSIMTRLCGVMSSNTAHFSSADCQVCQTQGHLNQEHQLVGIG